MKNYLIPLLFFISPACLAQKFHGVNLVIQNKYLFEEVGQAYLTVGMGYLASYPCYNKNEERDRYYHITTRARLNFIGLYHKPISPRFEWFSGVQLAQNKHGLLFKFNTAKGFIKEYAYSVSNMLRIPFGITYRVTPSFNIAIVATFIYSAHHSTHYTGSIKGDFSSSNFVAYEYKWLNDFEDDKYFAAADIFISKEILKKIYLTAQMSIDFKHAVSMSGESSLKFENNIIENYSGATKPLLIYAGVGVSYRFR